VHHNGVLITVLPVVRELHVDVQEVVAVFSDVELVSMSWDEDSGPSIVWVFFTLHGDDSVVGFVSNVFLLLLLIPSHVVIHIEEEHFFVR